MEKSTHTPEYALLRAELRTAREGAQLSQRDLASRLKVPHSWIAKVEMGERRIDLIEFAWFISACGLDSIAVTERLLKHVALLQSRRNSKGGRRK